MNKLLKPIMLSRQALLFDSYTYVLKAFLAVLTGYGLFHQHPIVGKDMISMMFALMMTLEPSNIGGIKSGMDQIKSSILGGVTTAIIVSLFGINLVTIPLGIASAMYISLKLNWRFVSPVTIFTAIYMTQYIQLNAAGDPSMLITLRLRLLALAAGIAIAVLYNFIFSKIFHDRMLKKRIVYILESLIAHIDTYVREERTGDLKKLKTDISSLFGDIDVAIVHLYDFKRDKDENTLYGRYGCALNSLRDFTHYLLDVIMFRMQHEKGAADLESLKAFSELLDSMKCVTENKNSDCTELEQKLKFNQSLSIEEESYLDAMHQSCLRAAKCFLKP